VGTGPGANARRRLEPGTDAVNTALAWVPREVMIQLLCGCRWASAVLGDENLSNSGAVSRLSKPKDAVRHSGGREGH